MIKILAIIIINLLIICGFYMKIGGSYFYINGLYMDHSYKNDFAYRYKDAKEMEYFKKGKYWRDKFNGEKIVVIMLDEIGPNITTVRLGVNETKMLIQVKNEYVMKNFRPIEMVDIK